MAELLASLQYQITPDWQISPLAGIQQWNCKLCKSYTALGLSGLRNFKWNNTNYYFWGSYIQADESIKAHQYRLGVGVQW